jgi:Domain of unknown function DUF11
MSTPPRPAWPLVGTGGVLAAVLLVAGLTVPTAQGRVAAAADPMTDLAVSQTASVTQAPVGTIVSFVSLAWNNGPDDAANSVFDSFSRPVGLVVRHETCIGPPRVSADGQFCEYSGVPIGQKVKTVIRTKLTGAPGSYASLRVCASSGVATTDPVSSNNCRTTKVLITAE